MRGKVCACHWNFNTDRITPAYAGKSGGFHILREFGQDHPRLCGEKKFTAFKFDNSQGSPPPMRGKGNIVVMMLLYYGITPAYAGKSVNYVINLPWCQDHPRLCGEKLHTVGIT